MLKEKNYDFLKRLRVIHQPERRNRMLKPGLDEVSIDENWKIVISAQSSPLIRRAALDFQDYLLTSMLVSVPVVVEESLERGAKKILLATLEQHRAPLPKTPSKSRGFFADISEKEGILLGAFDDKGVFAGTIHWEDGMNFREAPFLKKEQYLREPLTRMRSIHSGSGIDDFPDWQLNAIAHAGFTAIELFVQGPEHVSCKYCNINDVIERAAAYGLDVVFYSYLHSYKHPDDPDAKAFFDSIYGDIFRRYPGATALHVVGESLGFPSKDPHTSGKKPSESIVDEIPDTKPSPGWYPCYDYPAYLQRIVDAVHAVKPDAEIIMNTYNWGWCPIEERKKFLAAMPKGVTLQVTYDIFKLDRHDGLNCPVMDYSISAEEPGGYFVTEVEAAHELGIQNIRVTSNLAGTTWDFGTAPYVPVPFRWLRRMEILKKYLLSCNVSSFYDNHHYGWWPNPCIDMAKEVFSSNGETDIPGLLKKVACRDYGSDAADFVLEAWKCWSDAMDYYVGTNEDQYGPWRVGPAYPFIFQPNISRVMARKEIPFPTVPHAHFGYKIIRTFYGPYENSNQSPAPLRYPSELKRLAKMLDVWETGLTAAEKAMTAAPEAKRANAERLYLLGKFIRNSIRTTTNIKKWWMLNMELQVSHDRETMLAYMDRIAALAEEEIQNVRDTFVCVEGDSRIGWEPSMEYVCDAWHLNWKLRQMESMKNDLALYRKLIQF